MVRRVVIAPHADDEVLGCGGLLAKYPDTQVVVVAGPGALRRKEMALAHQTLGLKTDPLMLGFPDGDVGQREMALVLALDDALAAYQPDEVYLPYPGSHQDHVAVYEAGMRACRQSLNPDHWMPGTVLVYETPTYDLDLQAWGLRYSVFESLEEDHVIRKSNAMLCYESQVQKPHAGSPDELRSRARSLGLAREVEYAEQFAPVRVVRR